VEGLEIFTRKPNPSGGRLGIATAAGVSIPNPSGGRLGIAAAAGVRVLIHGNPTFVLLPVSS
jgi:hypothetical protein